MASPSEYALFIDGHWRDARGGRRFSVENPADGSIVAELPDADRADMADAIEAAVRAQADWAARPAHERGAILLAVAEAMRAHAEELARLMTLEEGKPLPEARGEIVYAASFLEWFGQEADRIYGDILAVNDPNKRLFVLKRPVGVTAAITPWNFPAAMIARKVGPALAAGCTMVVKPSELTPLSALAMARLFEAAGLPPGVLSVVAGQDAPALAQVVMADARVRKVSFTGSTEVGQILMRQAADTVKRLSLELGGHAPLIVFEDCDMEAAVAQAVIAKMRGMGETCVSPNRFYVQRSIAPAFAQAVAERLAAMRVGNGLEAGVEVGPLVEEAAVAKVERHVRDAVGAGARLVLGGQRVDGPGHFYLPTVLSEVHDDMLVSREETFGPVVPLSVFDDEQEAIRRANDTPYGLAAYFFTRDAGRVLRLAERLEYGILGANDGLPSNARAPFGGVKASGFGREGGRYGMDEYLDVKYLSLGGVGAV
jgi:succinate-semialdehyde dehydrogenase / glutarate-semialdehyde dehydrogenase